MMILHTSVLWLILTQWVIPLGFIIVAICIVYGFIKEALDR